jgi:general secretion pathway protein B
MSYILDALKKAEQERDLGRVPRLEAMHDNAPRRARALPWLIAGILVVNVAALIWWLRPGAHSGAATPVQQAPLPSVPPPPIAQAVPVSPVAPTINRMPAPAVVAPPVAKAPVTPVPPPVAEAPVASVPPHAPVTTPVLPAAPAPVAARPAVTSVPLLRDLPAEFRAAVPPLSLDVHVYAPNAASRFVLINMKKYHEGEQLAEGPRIEEITEEGVVLDYQGQMFRIARP